MYEKADLDALIGACIAILHILRDWISIRCGGASPFHIFSRQAELGNFLEMLGRAKDV